MMLLSISPSDALALLDHPTVIREDTIVPSRVPPCPDSPYRAGYDWLFVYERQIARFLSSWLSGYRYSLIGQKGLLCEALSNAFSHGNGRDPDRPIQVTVQRGRNGLIVRITDDGTGFPVDQIFNQFASGRKYFTTAGNGMRLMAESVDFGIYYDSSGHAFHLMRLFDNDMDRLQPYCIRMAGHFDTVGKSHKSINPHG